MTRQDEISGCPPPRLPSARIGLLLLAGALILYGFNVLIIDPARTFQGNLWTWPDAPEYLDGALSLVRQGQYVIHVAGQEHPPRYPMGHSLAIAAAYLLGADVLSAPYRVNQACGLLLLLVLFWILHRRGRTLEGGLAALLLSSLPAFVVLCRSPLSEPLGTLVILVAAWLLYEHARRGHLRLLSTAGAAGALLLGLSLNIRLANFFWAPLLAAAVFSPPGIRMSRRIAGGTVLGLIFLAGGLPLFIYNQFTFGHFLSTGYGYWVSEKSQFLTAFRPEHVPTQLAYLWSEFTQSEHFTTASIYGHGSYLSPAFILLGILSLMALRGRRFYWFSALSAFYFLTLLFYFYDDGRMYFSFVVLTVAPTAVGTSLLIQGLVSRQGGQNRLGRVPRLAVVLLLIAAIAAFPGPDGWSGTWTLLGKEALKETSHSYQLVESLKELADEPPKAVLTDVSVVYMHALLPWPVDVVPLTNEHLYRSNKENFDFKDRQRRDFMITRVQRGRTIYVASLEVDVDEVARLPVLADYEWDVLLRTERGGILRLRRPQIRASH